METCPLSLVLRQNSIRAKNGTCLSPKLYPRRKWRDSLSPRREQTPAFDRELFLGVAKALLDRILGTPAVCVYIRMDEESVRLSSSIITVMQPVETLMRNDATGGY
jgi:hypothetical protein